MRTSTNLLLQFICLVTLTACGGGGGDDASSNAVFVQEFSGTWQTTTLLNESTCLFPPETVGFTETFNSQYIITQQGSTVQASTVGNTAQFVGPVTEDGGFVAQSQYFALTSSAFDQINFDCPLPQYFAYLQFFNRSGASSGAAFTLNIVCNGMPVCYIGWVGSALQG